MSSNPIIENPKEETKLLGNKTKPENEIQTKDEKTNICHVCEKEKSSYLECFNCHLFFCYNCISNLLPKEKYENLVSDESQKLKWVCFVCQKNCPCKNCSTQNNDSCLLCNEKNNLINYNEIIKKLPYTQEEKNLFKNKDKNLKIILEHEGNILICSNCIQKNNILSQFLGGKSLSLIFETKEEKNQNINENNEKKPKENIFNVLDKQIGNNSINSKPISFPQNENNINNINNNNSNNQNSNSINNNIININENTTPKDFQQVNTEENQKNFIPGLNNNLENQIPPFYMNIPRNSTMNNNNNNTKELTATFAKIAESLQNFNVHNLQNNLNVLSNINQLTGIISAMLNDSNKKGEEKKDDNSNSSNSMISYMMTIIEDLKKQINVIQYYTQLQKYFIGYIMKYLELFMEQISNQNFLNEQKGTFFPNQIPNLFQMPISNINNMNPPFMNIIKQMQIPMNTTMIPGLNIPTNIPSLNLNQNNNDDKKDQNKNNSFNLMFQQPNQNSGVPLKINGLNPIINNITIPNIHEQNMFDQIKNSQNSNLNKINTQFIPNQNTNNPNLNTQIPNIQNQLFPPQFNLNNQTINPQSLFFNTHNNANNDNINNMNNISNINNITSNINNLGNIPNLNNTNQGRDITFNPSIINQGNPLFYQMFMNNQNPIDLNEKGDINNPQIKKDN